MKEMRKDKQKLAGGLWMRSLLLSVLMLVSGALPLSVHICMGKLVAVELGSLEATCHKMADGSCCEAHTLVIDTDSYLANRMLTVEESAPQLLQPLTFAPLVALELMPREAEAEQIWTPPPSEPIPWGMDRRIHICSYQI